ncbi:MAG: dihydrolipoyl dehydrogenase [Gammaproteobacteria bacterium]|nr:dihydrolipoyl dehydrogenase [Gammaproteobacteria bacterium]MDX2460300.1 dihydrolipoyl dehydrogenase [Gammaproteobacteria bacterium]
MKNYDVVVIGGGPGGYVAAIRCGQLGLATALVDEWLGADGKPALGGTCLNVGCIPSKALLDSSHHYHNIAHLLPAHGITVKGASMDIATMQSRKDKVVQTMNRGVAALLKKNKVDAFSGHGRLQAGNRVAIAIHGGSEEVVAAKNVIIATGSVPINIPVAPVDGHAIVDNVGALAFDKVPKRLGVIGAGVIGLELGSVWNRLGSDVVILEALADFLPAADTQVARDALKIFTKKQGLAIHLGARVTGAKATKKGVSVKYEDKDGSKALEVDRLVVAVGRRAFTEGLIDADVALAMDDGGRIQVDEACRTSINGVYAVGDVVRGPMLAHKASEEGAAVAELIAGQAAHIDHRTVPWVIYTHPEIAWVGDTEQQLKSNNIDYRSGSFPYRALGRAHGAGETDGFVKILADGKTDEILGVHILGAQASELIAEAVTAMVFRASSEDLARTIHAHPTLSEAMHEAALAVDGRAIHI